jgi:hypothetical protein
MKKLFAAALAILALAAGTLDATAQMGTSNGVVVSTTPTAVVVRTDDGVQRTYTIDNTSIMPTASLRVGDRITVDYNTRTSGDYLVSRVTVVPGTSATSTTTSPSSSYSTTSPSTTSTTSPSYSTTSTSNYSTTNDSYPDTAGSDTLFLLLGLAALAGAFGFRAFKRA